MIQRTTYLNRLIQLRDQDLIKVITGIRRCGKSTLLQAFRQYLLEDGVPAEAIVSLNFEERDNARFSSWEEVYDHLMSQIGRAHV